jgi:predicted N-formylglutamate amidohydrolase
VSEATTIPGNAGLEIADKHARQTEIFDPYHGEIASRLDVRRPAKPIYIAMHSFTPNYLGAVRPMNVAVLYNRRPRLSQIFAALLRREGDLVVAENDPYRVTDETDYGVPVHAERNDLDYLEIEIRQDLIAAEHGQMKWVERLERLLPIAIDQMEKTLA